MQRNMSDDLLTASTKNKDKRSLLTDFVPTLLFELRLVRKERVIYSGQNLTPIKITTRVLK